MPSWPHVFGTESGSVSASQLDDNFNAAAFASDLTALTATVNGLPSSAVPLKPVAGGVAGVAATLSRSDHQHPPQQADQNLQTGTTYTLASTDDGKVVDIANAGAITLTLPNSLAIGFSVLITQGGAGAILFSAAAGATIRQRQGFTHTAGQYAVASLYVRTNGGGNTAEWVLSGDLVA